MTSLLRQFANRVFPNRTGIALANFNSWHYLRHNARRLEHLATLGLPVAGRNVLEVGAGIGDHTHFYLDRGCQVITTEGREENFTILKQRYPKLDTYQLDLDDPQPAFHGPFDLIHCYGVLYHLNKPIEAIAFLASLCRELLLLETCVSFGEDDNLNPCSEKADDATQALSGVGCRPTRRWVVNQLKRHFARVYLPLTQPWHEEFPIDWTAGTTQAPFSRAVFIASRNALNNPLLSEEIPLKQKRC
jgi:hypothetical protein